MVELFVKRVMDLCHLFSLHVLTSCFSFAGVSVSLHYLLFYVKWYF